MQTSLFQSAQRIIAQTLQWLTTATDTSIAERVSDTFQNGVCYNELNSMAIVGKDLDPTLPNFFSIEVQTGISYVNGERIAILDVPLITYNALNPSQTTNDGTGFFVATPQSTGSFAIPLTTGSVNYIFIAYLATIDTSVFTLNDVTLGKQFYKQDDGYQIVVNTTGISPSSSYILLGQVDLTGTNQAVASNISIVNRPYYKTLLNRVSIQTNNNARTDRPSSYTTGTVIGNNYFLDDHVKAIGTGIVSPFNAHGISLEDLGVNPNDTVEFHRIHEHVNGLIAGVNGNSFPIGSAMFAQRIQVTPGDDYIVIQALGINEVAVLNGVAYTSTQFGSPFTVVFSGNPSGVYNVYFDGTTFGITQSDISADETKLWLATTTWTPTPGDGNLSVPADRRQMGTLDALERWVTAGRPQNPINGNIGFNITTNLLEYWDGTTWQQPVNSSSNSTVPSGALLDFAGSTAPAGYLLCDGTSYATSTYPNLFGAIGYTWGGAGANFNVPDLRGRTAIGMGAGPSLTPRVLGQEFGEETHVLTTPEIPSHTHGVTDPGHHHVIASSVNMAGSNNARGLGGGLVDFSTNTATTGITNQNTGGDGAHNNMQPSAVVNKIIKF